MTTKLLSIWENVTEGIGMSRKYKDFVYTWEEIIKRTEREFYTYEKVRAKEMKKKKAKNFKGKLDKNTGPDTIQKLSVELREGWEGIKEKQDSKCLESGSIQQIQKYPSSIFLKSKYDYMLEYLEEMNSIGEKVFHKFLSKYEKDADYRDRPPGGTLVVQLSPFLMKCLNIRRGESIHRKVSNSCQIRFVRDDRLGDLGYSFRYEASSKIEWSRGQGEIEL